VARVSRIELKRAESIASSTKRRFLEPAHTHTHTAAQIAIYLAT
jgi:hypothetical protein